MLQAANRQTHQQVVQAAGLVLAVALIIQEQQHHLQILLLIHYKLVQAACHLLVL